MGLAARKARVYIAAFDKERGDMAVQLIKDQTGMKDIKKCMHFTKVYLICV